MRNLDVLFLGEKDFILYLVISNNSLVDCVLDTIVKFKCNISLKHLQNNYINN